MRDSAWGARIRGLVAQGVSTSLKHQIAKVIAVHPYWPEALSALGDVLQFDREALEPGVEDRVRALIETP